MYVIVHRVSCTIYSSTLYTCLNVQWCWKVVDTCLSHAGPMERSSVCLLPVLEEEATERARKDCLEEALELALEERGFLLPTELVLLREERASGKRQREKVAANSQWSGGLGMVNDWCICHWLTEKQDQQRDLRMVTSQVVTSVVNYSIGIHNECTTCFARHTCNMTYPLGLILQIPFQFQVPWAEWEWVLLVLIHYSCGTDESAQSQTETPMPFR